MHVAAADPIAVSTGDVDANLVEREKAIFEEQVAREGKAGARIREQDRGGASSRKFFRERVLLEQSYIKDPDRTRRRTDHRSVGAHRREDQGGAIFQIPVGRVRSR